MAQALASSNDLVMWARREVSYAAFAGLKHQRKKSAIELSVDVEVLCLCLPGDRELENLMFDQGIADSLRADAIVINHATGDPLAAEHMARRLGEKGIQCSGER